MAMAPTVCRGQGSCILPPSAPGQVAAQDGCQQCHRGDTSHQQLTVVNVPPLPGGLSPRCQPSARGTAYSHGRVAPAIATRDHISQPWPHRSQPWPRCSGSSSARRRDACAEGGCAGGPGWAQSDLPAAAAAGSGGAKARGALEGSVNQRRHFSGSAVWLGCLRLTLFFFCDLITLDWCLC